MLSPRICRAAIAWTVVSASLLVAAPAFAGRDDMATGRTASRAKSAEQAAPAEDGSERPAGFTMQSGVVALDPDVAAALRLASATPNDPGAWRALGAALAEKGDYVDAIEAFERAVDLDDEDPDAWADLGAVLVRSGRVQRAAGALRRALRIEPFHGLAHYNLGLAYDAMDRYDAALDEFEMALTIDPRLGDPAFNPSAATNRHLAIVKLRVYMRTVGAAAASFSLPESR